MLIKIKIKALIITDVKSETFVFTDFLADLVVSMTFFKEVIMIIILSFLSMMKD